MPNDPQAAAPASHWRTLHDRLLADPALRRAAKEIDPGAFSLASTRKRQDDAIWQAHVRSADLDVVRERIARSQAALDPAAPP